MSNLKQWLATLLVVGAGCYVFGYCTAPRPKPNVELLLLQAKYAKQDSTWSATLATFRQQARELEDTLKSVNAELKVKAAETERAHAETARAKTALAGAGTVRDSLDAAVHVIWEQETELVSVRATVETQQRALATLEAKAATWQETADTQAVALAQARHLIHKQVNEINRLSSRPKGWSGSTGFLFGAAVGVALGATVVAVAR